MTERYELGDLSIDQYRSRRDVLLRQRDELAAASRPIFIRQRTTLRSLVDDWEGMTLDEKKRLLLLIFKEIVVDDDGIAELVPHDDWKPYGGRADEEAGTT